MLAGVVYDVMWARFHYVMHSTGTNGSHSRHQTLSRFLRSRVLRETTSELIPTLSITERASIRVSVHETLSDLAI